MATHAPVDSHYQPPPDRAIPPKTNELFITVISPARKNDRRRPEIARMY